MRGWVLAPVLIAAFLLLARPLVWSADGSPRPLVLGPTPAATATPRPPVDDAEQEKQGDEAREPSEVRHRPMVLQRLACANCHQPGAGWPVPNDHASFTGQECEDCHLAGTEPPAVGIHRLPTDPATEQLCTLCHADIAGQAPRPLGEAKDCSSCHADTKPEVLPEDHSERSLATCMVCHETKTLAAPSVPHRVEGWERCSFCHGPGRLTPLEGAHKDQKEDECVSCHEVGAVQPSLQRKMHELSTEKGGCLSCHGKGLLAPLPTSHEGRAEALCTLCHTVSTEEKPPPAPHTLSRQQTCDRCHSAGGTASVPYGHETRSAQTCTACHDEVQGGAPPIRHTLEDRTNCTDCHTQSPGRPGPAP